MSKILSHDDVNLSRPTSDFWAQTETLLSAQYLILEITEKVVLTVF